VSVNTVVTSIFSPGFQELWNYISALHAPFSLEDIQGFNIIYARVYSSLTREERRRIEEFVDTMVDKVARKEWAARIYGVV
jgi:hypothetical protein